ncbi:ATP-binding protein [Streptomyces sp. RPT161]|uniref:ATP-binding protein n=1 Tax=Streptomyces sp. RPT161 TaxID=3015993 RepID=UPI0022B88D4C|nr:ATP-binding protein [Streptomyces sp. RPT161]
MSDTQVLAGLLEELRQAVASRVAELSADDPTAHDPLRGLYLSPEAADQLLARPGPAEAAPRDHAASIAETNSHPRWDLLCTRFGLDALDRALLLVALAPDLDRRFAPLYGYLNDDVGKRRATVGLALDLCGRSTLCGTARARLLPGAPLADGRLLLLEQPERPFLERELRVPDRVTAYLLDGDGALRTVAGGAVSTMQSTEGAAPTVVGAALRREPARPVYLRCPRGQDHPASAARACAGLGQPLLHLDPARVDPAPHAHGEAVADAVREARLWDAVLLVGPLPTGAEADWVRAVAELPPVSGAVAVPQVLFAAAPLDPVWTRAHLLALDAAEEAENSAVPSAELWQKALPAAGFDPAEEAGAYRLSPDQIDRAARTALDLAAVRAEPLRPEHLHQAARSQNAVGLERHARRVRPAVGLPDLVLPAEPLRRIEELVHRARHREQVLRGWGMRRGGGRGSGVIAVFAGESGTGKTLAAEVVAGALGLDLYVVELSAVVDKYVGETEKNLERIFAQADAVNAVLLFDEADAVFGKRSEVKDSHDRYANLESAYLLQRLEAFDGVAVLTTNLRGNIDEAFTRRFDVVVDFPFPDEEQRRALWEHCLRPPLPVAEDVQVGFLAREFELAGGAIRSAAVTAAYLAAAAGRPVGAADLLEGARREYAKSGRLVPSNEAEAAGIGTGTLTRFW